MNSLFYRLLLFIKPDCFCSLSFLPNIPTFSALNMPLLTPRLNYDQARALVDANFTDIRFPDVALGHDTEDKRVKLFIVHGRRHVEPKGSGTGANRLLPPKYHSSSRIHTIGSSCLVFLRAVKPVLCSRSRLKHRRFCSGTALVCPRRLPVFITC